MSRSTSVLIKSNPTNHCIEYRAVGACGVSCTATLTLDTTLDTYHQWLLHTQILLNIVITNSHYSHNCTPLRARHTTRTFQHPLHVFAQCSHLWVAFHGYDHVAHCHQGLLGASFHQMCMEELILFSWITLFADFLLIAIRNDVFMYKFKYNGIGIHFFNESLPKVAKNFVSCTEREEM